MNNAKGQQIPCGYRNDEKLWDEPENLSEDEAVLPVYRNNTHRAAIEGSPHISISGLTIMWSNWAALMPSQLPVLIHGFKMCSSIKYGSPEFVEIDFLESVAEHLPKPPSQ